MSQEATTLTTPDLVVLALLAEGPRHGYDLNAELERRDVRDWAGISRSQVYYSLRKLERAGLLVRDDRADSQGIGPERRVLSLAPGAREAIAQELARPVWATQRPPPPFLTWLALSWLADQESALDTVGRRRAFLRSERDRELATLAAIRAELGLAPSVPALMVDLTIRQFDLELVWLDEVEALLDSRGIPASNTARGPGAEP